MLFYDLSEDIESVLSWHSNMSINIYSYMEPLIPNWIIQHQHFFMVLLW